MPDQGEGWVLSEGSEVGRCSRAPETMAGSKLFSLVYFPQGDFKKEKLNYLNSSGFKKEKKVSVLRNKPG